MRADARMVLGTILLMSCTLLPAQRAGTNSKTHAEVSFQFVREGLAVPRFTLRIREDGSGSYQADQVAKSASDTVIRGEAAQHIDRTLAVSPATVATIFKAAHSIDYFNVACASKAKNIADTGTKTLSYSGGDGSGSCIYNYSENKNVVMLTKVFLGIANTMDEGRKLEFLHRYDRLGLDAEMEFLSQQIEDGEALEPGTISATLASIAADTALIQRVRLRAAKMLEQVRESH